MRRPVFYVAKRASLGAPAARRLRAERMPPFLQLRWKFKFSEAQWPRACALNYFAEAIAASIFSFSSCADCKLWIAIFFTP